MFCVVLVLFAFAAGPQLDAAPSRVVVSGATPEQLQRWNALSKQDLQTVGTVSVVQMNRSEESPMLGEWSIADGLLFTPRFAFEPTTAYRVTIKDVVDATFTLPEVKASPGKVTAVFPAGDKLPANLLRFYIHFESEMKTGQGYDHFQLLDSKGDAVPFAFLELDEELWTADGKRLTLLLDPGRVKKELRPRKELGPVLDDNQKYTLRISKDYRTKVGQPLAADFRKTFTTMAAVEAGLEPANWKLTAPPNAGTKDAVQLKFDTLMDHALLGRVITVQHADGKTVDGTNVDDPDDTRWRWTPKNAWPPGSYSLVIENVLEDVCGNRIGAAFDAVIGKIGARALKAPTKLPFTIRE